jgi:hypothetical protein
MKKIYTHFSFLNFISMPKIEERQYKTLFTTLTNLMKKNYASFILACLLFFSGNAFGQQSITTLATTTSQPFTIGTSATATLPTGFKIGTDWSSGTTATVLAAGTSGTGALNGSSGGNVYNFASGVTASSTDRSIGFLSSGAYTSPKSIVYAFTNNTGSTVTTLYITFDYEKYRTGTRAFDWTFFHGNTVTPSTSATSGDQSYAADGANAVVNPPTTISKTTALTGLSIANGTTYYFKWTYTGNGGSTNAQGLGLDNFTIILNPYIVTYNGNSNTSGTVPNATYHASGSNVTVASNSGSLLRTGYTYNGWNTAADGSGTHYDAGSGTISSISSSVTLYAEWTPVCTAQTITAISPSTITKTYGDAIYSVATTASSGLTVTYASSATGVATVDASGDVTIVGPGTATITASQAGNGTYCAAANVTQALTVNPKNLTISGLTANNKTFDGTTTATLSGTPTLVGIVGSDAVTVSGSPAANFSDALVGTGKTVTVTGYTLSGADAGKYTLSQPTGLTADIIAASNAIDLSPTTQAKGPYCNATSNSIALTYTITGTVTAPFIELSNTSGSFASGTTNLGGTVTGSGTFTITGTIPAAQTASTAYRVRIVSTDAIPVISLDNNSNITVTAATTPTVSIASSPAAVAGTTSICAGTSVNFTPTSLNLGGGTATYEWFIGGISQGVSPTFSSTTLANGNAVTCTMTVSGGCVTTTTAISNTITMVVNPLITPSVSIVSNPAAVSGTTSICSGTNVSFTASPTNGGTPSYQWKLNGGNVGTNSTTYSNSSLADGSVISCVMTSTATCASPTTATSSGITITNNTPAQPTFTTSSTSVALGQAGVVYTVSNVSGVSYAWSYSGTGAIITGAPSNSVTIDFSTSATSGNLTVTPSYLGCTGTARVIAITAAASNESNVVDNTPSYSSTAPEFNINPDYINFIDATSTTTGKMIPMKLKIQDGGNDLTDADKLNTILTGIKFTVRDHLAANQLAQIKTAILTTSAGTVIATASKVGTELVFTGMSGTNVTAVDVENAGSGERIIHLRVSFEETQVIDNTKLVFQVSGVTAGSSSSTFAAADGGAAQSDNSNGNDRNRVEITATKLLFVQQPSTSSISSTMSPSPTVRATDAYNRTDADYATSISITSTGTMTGDPISATPSSGVSTYASVVHTVAGTGLTLTATSGSLTSVTSNPFDITTYVNGDWHSITGTGLLWNNAANWMQVISGSLSAPGGGGGLGYPNTGNPNVHLYATMNTNGSRSVNNLTIYSGAQLTTTSGPCTVAGTLLVKTGGTMNMSNLLNINGTLQVDSAGTFIYAYTNSSSRSTSVWNGVENFHPKSNFVLTELQNSAGFLFIEDKDDITENTYNGFTACFGNMSFERASGSGAMGLFPSGFVKNLAHGNVVFKSGTSDVRMADAGSGFNTTIGGRLIIESTFGNNINFSNSAITGVLNVKGQVIHNGTGALRFCSSSTTTNMTMNIDSSMSITNTGNFTFNATNNASYTGILRIKGDLTVASGANLTNASTAKNGIIVFNGIGDGSTPDLTQVINISATNATRNQYINFNVGNGAYVQLGDDLELGNSAKVTDSTGGTFDFGFNGSTPLIVTTYSSGAGFESRQGSTLKITSPDGLYDEWDRAAYTAAGVTVNTGNVQAIAKSNRSFSPIATFWYIGKADQKTGDAPNVTLSTSADAKVVICDLANKNLVLTPTVSFGVTDATTISPTGGKLDIRNGQFIETETEYIFGSTGTLYMSPGTLYKIVKGSSTDPFGAGDDIPRMDGSGFPYVLTGGTIELGGTGTNHQYQRLRSDNAFYNYVYVKYSGNNTSGTFKNLNQTTNIDSALIITGTPIVDCFTGGTGSAASFIGNGGLIMDGGLLRIRKRTDSNPELDGLNAPYTLTGGTIEFYGTVAPGSRQQIRGTYGSPTKVIEYNNLEINADEARLTSTGPGNVDLTSSFTLKGTMNVNAPAILNMDSDDFIYKFTGNTSNNVNINSGAGLTYGSPFGITTVAGGGTGLEPTVGAANPSAGNIRTNIRTFDANASYGFVSPGNMVSGSGLPATVKSLYVLKSNLTDRVTLTNSVRADSALRMYSGHIITGSNRVELGKDVSNRGTLDYTAGYVVGNMRRWYDGTNSGNASGLYPLGEDKSGTLKNRKYLIEYSSDPTGGYLDVNFNPVNMGLAGLPITGIPAVGSCTSSFDVTSTEDEGYWIATPEASRLGDGAYKLSITGEDFSTVTDLCELTLLKRVGAGNWTTPGTHLQPTGSISVPTVSRSGITGFSNFGFGGGAPNPLPVELTSFTGTCVEDGISQITWSTASEFNSKHFIVQRSTDGVQYTAIAVIPAAGFSTQPRNYSITDTSVNANSSYYRLIEVDFNNQQTIYSFIQVKCNEVNGIHVFYTQPKVTVEVVSTKDKQVGFNVYEVSGKLLHAETKQIVRGYNRFDLSMQDKLAKGIYIIQMMDGEKATSTKVMVH